MRSAQDGWAGFGAAAMLLAALVVGCESFGANTTKDVADASPPSDAAGATDGQRDRGIDAGCLKEGCERLVFVTSLEYTGALGGLDGADQECQALAEAAGLVTSKRTTFRALISNTSTNAKDRLRRTLPGSASYALVNGDIVAADFDAFSKGELLNPIGIDESGKPVSANNNVWSGTLSNGAYAPGDNCAEWMSGVAAQTGKYGDASRTDGGWVEAGSDSCEQKNHLYCFED